MKANLQKRLVGLDPEQLTEVEAEVESEEEDVDLEQWMMIWTYLCLNLLMIFLTKPPSPRNSRLMILY